MNESRGVESAGRWERGSQATFPAMFSRERVVPLRRVALTEIPTLENPSPLPKQGGEGESEQR
jgi:hypothetical protein